MWVSRGNSDLALLLMWVQLHLALVFHPINCSGPRCDSSSASGSWTSVCWARHRKQPADQPASSPQGGRFESLPRHRHNLPESERKELVCMSGHILQLHHIYRVCVCVSMQVKRWIPSKLCRLTELRRSVLQKYNVTKSFYFVLIKNAVKRENQSNAYLVYPTSGFNGSSASKDTFTCLHKGTESISEPLSLQNDLRTRHRN